MKYTNYRKLSFVHTIFAAHNLQEVRGKYKMADPIKAKDEKGQNVEMQPYISCMICIAF